MTLADEDALVDLTANTMVYSPFGNVSNLSQDYIYECSIHKQIVFLYQFLDRLAEWPLL